MGREREREKKGHFALASFSPSRCRTPPLQGFKIKLTRGRKGRKRFTLTPFRRGLLLPAHLCSRLHDQIPLCPCPCFQGRSSSGSLLGQKSLQSLGHTHPCCWDGLGGMNLRNNSHSVKDAGRGPRQDPRDGCGTTSKTSANSTGWLDAKAWQRSQLKKHPFRYYGE